MRVNIASGDHQVEIEVDHPDPGYVIEKARTLWEGTKPPPDDAPKAGFTITTEVA